MNKNNLLEIIADQRKLSLPQTAVQRTAYAAIGALRPSKQILIISGLRRSGKSTLLQLIRAASPESDFYINFDDERLLHFSVEDFQMLWEAFIELYGEQKSFYFDEIQNIRGWERFARRLHDMGKEVFITGSNASMLSKELGTHLTGRHIQLELYPFSFREYLEFKNVKISNANAYSTVEKAVAQRLFRSYCIEGGLPEFLKNSRAEYLQSLYESILYRDIIVRHKLTHERPIKELVHFLASNIGKEVSYNNMKSLIGVSSASTVSEYCSYLEDSFLSFFINSFDFSLKKQIRYNKKQYFIDPALAQAVGFRMSADQGRILENMVFLELKRRGKEVYFHAGKKECDFIIRQSGTVVQAVQVASSLDSSVTRQREFDGLLAAMAEYGLKTGLILTEDQEGQQRVQLDGRKYAISIKPIWKWLLFDEN